MEPLDYVKKFKMDQPNYQFDRRGFIQELGNDFVGQIANCKVGVSQKTGYIVYPKFKEIVLSISIKFDSISKIREAAGLEPLSKKLWGVFYSNWVIVIRQHLYPGKAREIATRKIINKVNSSSEKPSLKNIVSKEVYEKLTKKGEDSKTKGSKPN